MNLVKNNEEIAKIKFAASIVGKALATLSKLALPGNSDRLLAKTAKEIILNHGCQPSFLNYQGFPDVVCISVNQQLVHGIPSGYLFQNGDLVSIDIGCQYQGYHADAALTVIVGQPKSMADQKLVAVTKFALDQVVNHLQPGMRVGDVGSLIHQIAKSHNYYVPKEYSGHGIGKSLHEPPFIFNFGQPGTGTLLQPGMVVCVEPMFLQNSDEITVLSDG